MAFNPIKVQPNPTNGLTGLQLGIIQPAYSQWLKSHKMKRLSILALILSCTVRIAAQQNFETKSPDSKVKITVNFARNEEQSTLTYQVTYLDKVVIEKSMLGINSGNANWERQMNAAVFSTRSVNQKWKPVYGEKSEYTDHFNETVISLKKNPTDRSELRIIVRAYNEGIAFRYYLPEHPDGGAYLRVTSENTEFKLPAGSIGYFTPTAQAVYKALPIAEFPGECERPLTVKLPNGLFASLTEADMVNYARTKFVAGGENKGSVMTKMYGEVDEITPFATPWRVVMVAEKPGQLLENNFLILNLNPENQISDSRWIKPGKVMREVTLSTSGAKELVDFAVKRNLQYIHFDAGWYGYEYVTGSDATRVDVDPRRNAKGDLNLSEAVRYAKSKGIGVILYVNQRALYRQLDQLLPLYKKWGIAGIKFGFVQVGSHRWTTWMHDAVKKCAENQLMVDIHDEYRPTGFSRTYPNLMTQEGVRGNEEMPDAFNNATLPFTRFVAGAADYTICYYKQDFGRARRDANGIPASRVIKTTSAHQLALAAIYYSPLQYMYWYDRPSDSQDEPELAFFDKVSTVWDDTRVTQGEIGEFITVARRKGKEWFVGTITGNESRKLGVTLDFLPEGKYRATIYEDDDSAKTRTKVGIRQLTVTRKSTVEAMLRASGGQAIHLVPIQ